MNKAYKRTKSIVFIPFETKVREFDGKILLAYHLLLNGYQVMLGSRTGILREIRNFHNCIYLAKSISKNYQNIYKEIKRNNNKLAVLNVEGGVLYKDEDSHFEAAYPTEARNLFDHFFLFGSKIHEGFTNAFDEIGIHKITISGDNRFDLLRPKYYNFYKKDIDSIKTAHGDFILINTSFSIANPSVGKESILDYIKGNKDFDGETRELLLYKHNFYVKVLESFIMAIGKLSSRFPNLNFVIRPHPSEAHTIYLENFKTSTNVSVCNNGNVHTWIQSAKGVIHYDCTTGIEAVLAQKPTIAYIPQKDDKIFAWLPAYVSKNATNLEELIEYVEDISMNKFIETLSEEKKETLNSYIANATVLSHDRIVNALNKMTLRGETIQHKKNIRLYYLRFRSSFGKIRRSFQSPDKKNISWNKFDNISCKEIGNKIDMLSIIEGDNYNVKTRALGGDVVWIK